MHLDSGRVVIDANRLVIEANLFMGVNNRVRGDARDPSFDAEVAKIRANSAHPCAERSVLGAKGHFIGTVVLMIEPNPEPIDLNREAIGVNPERIGANHDLIVLNHEQLGVNLDAAQPPPGPPDFPANLCEPSWFHLTVRNFADQPVRGFAHMTCWGQRKETSDEPH